MFEELKESIVPISQRIVESTNELRGLQDWPKMLPLLVIIVFVFVFLGYVLSKISLGFEPSRFALKAVVLFVIALIISGSSIVLRVNSLKSEVATLSKYKKDNEPYLKFLNQHLVQFEKKSVTSLKSEQETIYGFLWSSSDTKTLAYIDSQDSIEAVTITSKDIQETNRITMFVVYKDANKVILKSESGEIGMSAEDYTLLTKS